MACEADNTLKSCQVESEIYFFPSLQDSGSYPSSTHVPGPGNTMAPQQSSSSIPGSHSNAAYMKQQQQQMQLISQQKQYLQRQMMVEQVPLTIFFLFLLIKDRHVQLHFY